MSDAIKRSVEVVPDGSRVEKVASPAQMRHVHAKIELRVALHLSPHRVEQSCVRHGASRVRDQHTQERPFGGGEVHVGSGARHDPSCGIDDEITDGDWRIGSWDGRHLRAA